MFESYGLLTERFDGNQYFSGENSDLYWQRHCLMINSQMKNGLMRTQSHHIDSQVLPDLESSLFFQQVDSMKEAMEMKKLHLNIESDKQEISGSEMQS